MRKLSLVELGAQVEIALTAVSCRCGEHALFADLLPHLAPEMLLLLDQGFFGYEQWRRLTEKISRYWRVCPVG